MAEAEGLVDVSAATRPKRSEAVVDATAASSAVAKDKPKVNPVWRYEEFNDKSFEQQAAELKKGRYCVGENITLKQFLAKINELEGGGYFRWEFVDGKAWIYELSSNLHAAAASKFNFLLETGLGQHGDAILFTTDPTCTLGGRVMEPDGAAKVLGHRPPAGDARAADSYGNRFPNIILEVAFSETEDHARDKAAFWINHTDPVFGVQQVIVIKIGYVIQPAGHRTMKALRYARDAAGNPVNPANPAAEIEFGINANNNGATQAGMPAFQLEIPTASIFQPFPVPAAVPPNIPIDLYRVKHAIEVALVG